MYTLAEAPITNKHVRTCIQLGRFKDEVLKEKLNCPEEMDAQEIK